MKWNPIVLRELGISQADIDSGRVNPYLLAPICGGGGVSDFIGGITGNLTGSNQANAARDAAAMQVQAANDAAARMEPWAAAGQQGLGALQAGLGLGGNAGGTGIGQGEFMTPITMEQLQLDPGYAFRTAEGGRAIQQAAASGRSPYGSAAMHALMNYNQQAASQEYGNAFARATGERGFRYNALLNLAGMGANAAAGQGNIGMSAANAAAAGTIGAANASAQGTQNMIGLGTNAIALATLSDVRLKSGVEPIAGAAALALLLRLRAVTWEWNAEANALGLSGRSAGIIAQELQALAPELVEADESGLLHVNYGALTGYLIAGLQEALRATLIPPPQRGVVQPLSPHAGKGEDGAHGT